MKKPRYSQKGGLPKTKVNNELKEKRKSSATQNLNKKALDEVYNAVMGKSYL